VVPDGNGPNSRIAALPPGTEGVAVNGPVVGGLPPAAQASPPPLPRPRPKVATAQSPAATPAAPDAATKETPGAVPAPAAPAPPPELHE
jgi:hypothetical protein